MPDYTVVIAYTGECCTNTHIWIHQLKAADPKAAVKAMHGKLEARGDFPGDAVVLDGKFKATELVESGEV